MECPACEKEVVADRVFCTWCEAFIPNPKAGKTAGVVRRWFAAVIDPIVGVLAYFITLGIVGGIFGESGATVTLAILVTIGYIGFFIWELRRGVTPGKALLGIAVVNRVNGAYPGFWRMVFREIIGKFVSGLLFGLGFFWAIWDKEHQAWHDKLAGTVVVKRVRK